MTNSNSLLQRSVLKYEDEKIEVSKLQPGDQVYVAGNIGQTIKRVGRIALYKHHAVYVGEPPVQNSRSSTMELKPHITDFGRANKKRPDIDTLEKFLGGKRTVFRRNYKNCDKFHSVESLWKRAEAFAAGEIGYRRYHLINNNCEHYATLLRTGVRESPQVSNIIRESLLLRVKTSLKRPGSKIRKACKKFHTFFQRDFH